VRPIAFRGSAQAQPRPALPRRAPPSRPNLRVPSVKRGGEAAPTQSPVVSNSPIEDLHRLAATRPLRQACSSETVGEPCAHASAPASPRPPGLVVEDPAAVAEITPRPRWPPPLPGPGPSARLGRARSVTRNLRPLSSPSSVCPRRPRPGGGGWGGVFGGGHRRRPTVRPWPGFLNEQPPLRPARSRVNPGTPPSSI